MKTYAIDFETYYSKTYSIRDLGNWAYTHHEEFDPFMLSVAGEDYEWVGNPKDFDWKLLNKARVIAHNAGFELAIVERLRELGIVPKRMKWAELHDTADLAAYCGYPRSLAAACKHMLGVELDKGIRDRAKGQRWRDMTPDFQADMKTYAMSDAKRELQLWNEWSDKWPQWERDLSRITRDMCWEGLPVNIESVDEAISKLDVLLWKVRSQIPWANDPDAAALSPKSAAEECRKHNIPPPKSMAKDSEEFDAWLRQYGELMPWAKAMGQYRSINSFLKKLQVMKIRTKPDWQMPISLKYGGAHTMRDSGDAGWNPLNLPRGLMFEDLVEGGIDIRGMIEAPDGKMLAVADLRAIEPCCIAVFSGDTEFVEQLRKGLDPYEASARVEGIYTDERPLKDVDEDLRKYQKVKVLGCGYGAGPEKVQTIAKVQVGLELSLQQATALVAKFRARRFIPQLWYRLERAMRKSVGKDFELELPSGRVMRYRDVKDYGGLSAVGPRLGSMMRQRFWGGTLTENLAQGAARDVLMWHVLQMVNEGIVPILRVYDEIVCMFDQDKAEAGLARMLEIMGTPPPWMEDLPVSAEGKVIKRYKKI